METLKDRPAKQGHLDQGKSKDTEIGWPGTTSDPGPHALITKNIFVKLEWFFWVKGR